EKHIMISCVDLLNINFIDLLGMIWLSQDLVMYLMKKSNETYLTTKNEQAVSNIEINQHEQSIYYLHNFASLVQSEFYGPRNDDLDIESTAMSRSSIGELYDTVDILRDEIAFHSPNLYNIFEFKNGQCVQCNKFNNSRVWCSKCDPIIPSASCVL
ncbi:16364_t:CDS:1, partial [Dentiscutata heterogama]